MKQKLKVKGKKEKMVDRTIWQNLSLFTFCFLPFTFNLPSVAPAWASQAVRYSERV